MKLLFTSLTLLVSVGLSLTEKPKVVCYWANWSGLSVEDIDATLCTHLHYAFFKIDTNQNTIADTAGWYQQDLYNRLNNLKKKNPDLKVIPSVGGWGAQNSEWASLVQNPTLRKKFIDNSVQVLKKYGFDGMDIDWEYPVCWMGDCNTGKPAERQAFGEFVKEIRKTFDTQTPKLTISAALVADQDGQNIADTSYDFKAIGEALNYLNVMTYDLAGVNSKVTQHHSAFKLSVKNLEHYVSKGVPKEKVLMGVPFYGHTYQLADINKHGEGAPVVGQRDSVKVGSEYRNVCLLVKQQNWKKDHGDGQHDPIAYNGQQWLGYDDPYSLYDKSKWVKDNGYGGIIIWEISQDDYRGSCCTGTKNPLLHAINHGLYGTGQGPETYGCEQK